jgi:ferredoxin
LTRINAGGPPLAEFSATTFRQPEGREEGGLQMTVTQHARSLRAELADTAAARPPGSLPEDDFDDRCDRCGDCLAVCPSALLVADGAGLPVIDRLRGVCGTCGLCADVCTRGAIAFAPVVTTDPRQRRLGRIRGLRRPHAVAGELPAILPGAQPGVPLATGSA